MTDIKSLHNEATKLEQLASGAQQEAQNIRAKAAQQMAGGQDAQAQNNTSAALNKEREAVDYSNKAQQKRAEADSFRQRAQSIQNDIVNKQRDLSQLTGEGSLNSLL